MNAGDLMVRDVVTVGPQTPVPEIVTVLLSRGISGVPVVDADGHLAGVVSEGDLLRRAEIGTEKRRGSWREFFTGTAALAQDYVRSHAGVASDVMTRNVITVSPDTPLGTIADIMEEKHIKRLPVLDNDKLVGLVTRANLLRAFASTVAQTDATSQSDDAAIREALSAELARQPWSRRADNSIVVTDGVVHLWGLVATREELRALQLAAESVRGVKAVRDHMIVLSEEPIPCSPARSPPERAAPRSERRR
jgi:CBS domain-containing protein